MVKHSSSKISKLMHHELTGPRPQSVCRACGMKPANSRLAALRMARQKNLTQRRCPSAAHHCLGQQQLQQLKPELMPCMDVQKSIREDQAFRRAYFWKVARPSFLISHALRASTLISRESCLWMPMSISRPSSRKCPACACGQEEHGPHHDMEHKLIHVPPQPCGKLVIGINYFWHYSSSMTCRSRNAILADNNMNGTA